MVKTNWGKIFQLGNLANDIISMTYSYYQKLIPIVIANLDQENKYVTIENITTTKTYGQNENKYEYEDALLKKFAGASRLRMNLNKL